MSINSFLFVFFNWFSFQSLVCLNGDVIRRETISAMPAGNAKFLMDSVFELAQRINRFRLSDAEIGLFCSVVIISAGRLQRRHLTENCSDLIAACCRM